MPVRSICFQYKLHFDQVRQAVAELPPLFRTDILVLENLEALRVDMHLWRQTS